MTVFAITESKNILKSYKTEKNDHSVVLWVICVTLEFRLFDTLVAAVCHVAFRAVVILFLYPLNVRRGSQWTEGYILSIAALNLIQQ